MRKTVGVLLAAGGLLSCSGMDELAGQGGQAVSNGQSGATLQASKTLDICTNTDGTWTYSGVVSVWNTGATDAANLHIDDWIQTKTGGQKFYNWLEALDADEGTIAAYTPEELAYTFSYSVSGPALAGDVRNSAVLTITNHSGSKVNGPNPKATWYAGTPVPACHSDGGGGGPSGCTLTQGYWGTHNNDVCATDPGSPLCVTWPAPYAPDNTFFLSGQTWLQVLGTPAAGNQYYVLAYQYIAAVLNQASGATVPAGVQQVIDEATTWFDANAPAACATPGSCGAQATWAGILDTYNNGLYPGGPAHCGS